MTEKLNCSISDPWLALRRLTNKCHAPWQKSFPLQSSSCRRSPLQGLSSTGTVSGTTLMLPQLNEARSFCKPTQSGDVVPYRMQCGLRLSHREYRLPRSQERDYRGLIHVRIYHSKVRATRCVKDGKSYQVVQPLYQSALGACRASAFKFRRLH